MSEISEWFVDEKFSKAFENFFSAAENPYTVEVLPKTTIELNLLSKTSRLSITKKASAEKPIYVFAKKLIDENFHEDVNVEKIRQCFVREAKVYSDFLNQLPPLELRISPKMFDFLPDTHQIMLEDLSVLGYKSQGKFLNLQQSEELFKQMATFHAFSLHFHGMGGKFTEFSNTICEGFTPTLKLMQKCAEDFLDELKTWEGFSPCADKVENFLPHYVDVLTRETQANPSGHGFNVLCHGDLHIGNVLIEENTRNIAMVDFQFSAWRSPAYDFFSAFNSMCEKEVNLNFREHLIEVYHGKFEALLRELRFSQRIPSLRDIHDEIHHHGFLDFYNWTYYLPLLLSYDRVDENLQTKFKRSLQHPDYKKIVQTLLPAFIEKGYLDIEQKQ